MAWVISLMVADSTLCVAILYNTLCENTIKVLSEVFVRYWHISSFWQYFQWQLVMIVFLLLMTLANMISQKTVLIFSQWVHPVGSVSDKPEYHVLYACSYGQQSCIASVCLSVCPSPVCPPQHPPGIHLQCHVGHYDNGCNSLPPGAPQPSHCSPGGRPAHCAAPLPSPKGNCLHYERPGETLDPHRLNLSQQIICKQTHSNSS